jgi:hypothetical protein
MRRLVPCCTISTGMPEVDDQNQPVALRGFTHSLVLVHYLYTS